MISNVQKYISNHVEERLSLNDVAAVFGLSPNYLSALFKKTCNIGFTEYITQKKVARARTLLLEQDLKIYEVADQLGFESAFYFSKVFKLSLIHILTITAAVTLAITAITVMVCYKTFQSFLRKAEIQSAEFNLSLIHIFSVHRDRIVGRRVFKIKSPLSHHVGTAASIRQHILPADHQIHVELVGMPVPRAHGPTMEM